MEETIIDILYKRVREILGFFDENAQPSLRSDADSHFRKVVILASASFFEDRIQEIIKDFASAVSNRDTALLEFIKNKAIARQYHTYFDWESGNANRFFGLFGKGFADRAKADVVRTPVLAAAVKCFIDLGRLRNELVHMNFAGFPIEKTTEECYSLYKEAIPFVEYIRSRLPPS